MARRLTMYNKPDVQILEDCTSRGDNRGSRDVRSENQAAIEHWFQEEFVRLFNENVEFHDQVLTCLLPDGNAETAAFARKCRRTWCIAPDLMETRNMGRAVEDPNVRHDPTVFTESITIRDNAMQGDAETPSDSAASTSQVHSCNDASTQVDECTIQPTKDVPHNVGFGPMVDSSCAPGFVDGKLTIQVPSSGFQSLWLLKGQLQPQIPDSVVLDRPESPLLALVSCGELPALDRKLSRPCVHCRGTQTWKLNPLYTSRSDTDSNASWQQEGPVGAWIQDPEDGRVMEDFKLRKIKCSVDSSPPQRINLWKISSQISDFRERAETQLQSRLLSDTQEQPTQVLPAALVDRSHSCKAREPGPEQDGTYDPHFGTSCTVATETSRGLGFLTDSQTSPCFSIDFEVEKPKHSTPRSSTRVPQVDIKELWDRPQVCSSAASSASEKETRGPPSNSVSQDLARPNHEVTTSISVGTGDKSETSTHSSCDQSCKLHDPSGTTLESPIRFKLNSDSKAARRTRCIGLLDSDSGIQPCSTGASIFRLSAQSAPHDVRTTSTSSDDLGAMDGSTSSSYMESHLEERTSHLQETKTRLSSRVEENFSTSEQPTRFEMAPGQIEAFACFRAVSNTAADGPFSRNSERSNAAAVGKTVDYVVVKPEVFPGHVPCWSTPVGLRPSPEIQWAPPRRNILKRALQSSSCRSMTSVLADGIRSDYDATSSK